MGMSTKGDWSKVKAILNAPAMKKANGLAMKKTLAYLEKQIKKNIVSSGKLAGKPFVPNAELTIAIKGSSKPLIDTGDMLGSVHPEYVNEKFGFVGLKRGKQHKDGGGDVADIAEVHENGAIVKDHEIPKRPFIGPVRDKFGKEAAGVHADTIKKFFESVAS